MSWEKTLLINDIMIEASTNNEFTLQSKVFCDLPSKVLFLYLLVQNSLQGYLTTQFYISFQVALSGDFMSRGSDSTRDMLHL